MYMIYTFSFPLTTPPPIYVPHYLWLLLPLLHTTQCYSSPPSSTYPPTHLPYPPHPPHPPHFPTCPPTPPCPDLPNPQEDLTGAASTADVAAAEAAKGEKGGEEGEEKGVAAPSTDTKLGHSPLLPSCFSSLSFLFVHTNTKTK